MKLDNLQMRDKKKLFVFEAIELRNEYDRHIKLLEKLINYSGTKNQSC